MGAKWKVYIHIAMRKKQVLSEAHVVILTTRASVGLMYNRLYAEKEKSLKMLNHYKTVKAKGQGRRHSYKLCSKWQHEIITRK